MTFLITLFAFSLFALVSMVGLKLVEVQSGRRFSFLRWRYKSDHLVRRSLVTIREFSTVKKAHTYLFLIRNLRRLIDVLINLRKYLLMESAKFFSIVKGKGHFGEKSSTAFFKQNTPEEESVEK